MPDCTCVICGGPVAAGSGLEQADVFDLTVAGGHLAASSVLSLRPLDATAEHRLCAGCASLLARRQRLLTGALLADAETELDAWAARVLPAGAVGQHGAAPVTRDGFDRVTGDRCDRVTGDGCDSVTGDGCDSVRDAAVGRSAPGPSGPPRASDDAVCRCRPSCGRCRAADTAARSAVSLERQLAELITAAPAQQQDLESMRCTQEDRSTGQSDVVKCREHGSAACQVCKISVQPSTGAGHHFPGHKHGRRECPHCAKCNACHALGTAAPVLNMDVPTSSKSRLFHCKLCGATMKHRTGLICHLQIHENTKKYKCPKCSAAFKARRYLNQHLLSHIDVRRHACSQCDARFKKKQHLQRHMATHSASKLFSCSLCPYRGKVKVDLTKHLGIHNIDRTKAIECSLCKLTLESKFALNRHKYHCTARKFVCSFCGARFIDKYLLKRHESIHRGHYPFCCQVCPASFRSRTELNLHKKRHDSSTDLRCKFCPVMFLWRRRCDLLSHVRSAHSDCVSGND